MNFENWVPLQESGSLFRFAVLRYNDSVDLRRGVLLHRENSSVSGGAGADPV
jgi:VIT1/CCC1 family predicted Fe2+/Mn2+ transporter